MNNFNKLNLVFVVFFLLCAVLFLFFPDTPKFWVKSFTASKSVPEEYLNTNVKELIRINSTQQLKQKRKDLIEFVWSGKGLPKRMPDEVRDNSFVVVMDYNIRSTAELYRAKPDNDKLVVFHYGHGGMSYESIRVWKKFLAEGFDVLAFGMPLVEPNNQPIIYHERFGFLKLSFHDNLKFLKSDSDSTIQYFVEPVVVVLNLLASEYDEVVLVGFSGGGWTALLVSAIDKRIDLSFEVAGSQPLFLRSGGNLGWGDYEQVLPELYETTNYLELYVLAAQNKTHMQILNEFDKCCFSGVNHLTYVSDVSYKAEQFDGEFKFVLDSTHAEHKLSDFAFQKILEEIK